MIFERLEINCLRNLFHVEFFPSEKFNFIIGENGSGKTSILEAIYLLVLRRSFRTHLTRRYLQHHQKKISLYSSLFNENKKIPLGLEKELAGEILVHFQGKNIDNVYELAEKIPIFLIHINSFKLLTDGPKERRKFFNFGLFHVEPKFLNLWREYNNLLKQRNAALRLKMSDSLITIWDHHLVERAVLLHKFTKQFIENYQIILNQIFKTYLAFGELQIEFDPGWDEREKLDEVFKKRLSKDIELGYTAKGPHRFDFKIKVNNMPVEDFFSRGQLKCLICSLYFSMFVLVQQETQKKGIFLIDDLPSEFDVANFERIMEQLSQFNTQIFLTSTATVLFESYLKEKENKLFHVKHGELEPIE